MAARHQLKVGSRMCALLLSLLSPSVSLAGDGETVPQTAPQELRSPPVDVSLPPPSPLQFQTLDLHFQATDLEARVEDVKGAVQALAVQETKTEVRIELSGDVLFDFDKATIRSQAEPALQRVQEIVAQYSKATVSIDGYTDGKGEDAYNRRLSDKRAAAVKTWLVEKAGVDGKRIKTKGWGKANPVAPNTHPDGSDNPDGRQKNRRVEITLKK
jgi:outer membrane protein OmpA-like peptidoglycan-associated protein